MLALLTLMMITSYVMIRMIVVMVLAMVGVMVMVIVTVNSGETNKVRENVVALGISSNHSQHVLRCSSTLYIAHVQYTVNYVLLYCCLLLQIKSILVILSVF